MGDQLQLRLQSVYYSLYCVHHLIISVDCILQPVPVKVDFYDMGVTVVISSLMSRSIVDGLSQTPE